MVSDLGLGDAFESSSSFGALGLAFGFLRTGAVFTMTKSLDPRLGLSAELEPFATAIGALCMEWNEMEAEVRYCLGYCLNIQYLEVGDAILTLFEFRDLAQATKLGIVDHIEDSECVDALISTIDYFDNTLRSRRNRFVHDMWYGGTAVKREHQSAQIVRPQSFRPREWAWKREEIMELEELTLTIEEIREHSFFLKELWIAYAERRNAEEWEEEWTVKGRLARQPPQRLQPLPPAKLHLPEDGPAMQ
ncbi:MAG: hypothetical protein ACJ8IR_06640 [Alphaproteobacteria bacterium]|jgi:hypothetical protein